MTAPEPVAPVDTVDLADLSGTEWRFANGAVVRFVPTTLAPGDLTLVATSNGGWSTLDPVDAAVAGLAIEAVAASGIGDLDREETRAFLADRALALGPYILETTEGFQGNAATADLELLFQQLHLAYTRPRIEADGVAEALDRGEQLRQAVATVPDRALDDAVLAVLFDGDERFSIDPPLDRGPDRESALSLYRARFGGVHDLEVALAGDADPALVADLAARYVGTLPAGTPDSFRLVRPVPPPPSGPVIRTVGRAGGPVAIRAVHARPQTIDARARVELWVLAAVVEARLTTLVAADGTGPPSRIEVELEPETIPVEGVRAAVGIELDGGDEAGTVALAAALTATLADLAANGPTDVEVAAAVETARARHRLVSNAEVTAILLVDAEEPRLTAGRRAELLAAVDVDDMAVRAALVFDGDGYLVRTRPVGS